MSWRTKGQYLGLDSVTTEWLRAFDHEWDTKAEGRCRTDAFDWLDGIARENSGTSAISSAEASKDRVALEASLLKVANDIARFTVPRQTKSGWSIHLVMKTGRRVRAHFEDLPTALQAYDVLEEYSLWFPKG